MTRLREFTLRPSDGGRLITTQAPENVGPENYVTKNGWRRVDDCEQLRESFDVLNNTTFPYNVIGIWEASRPNGDYTTVIATGDKIYRLDNTTAVPTEIGTGFSATKWQGESIDGYLILNNGVDLPVYFRVEDSAVVPLYELREIGVASVGAMCVANGFLMFGDTRMVSSTDQANWMNGASPYGKYTGTTNDIGFQIIWSDFGKPTNWAPVITGTIQSASKNQVTLQWPSQTFKVGDKLAVVGAGPNGGILGGQTEIPDGVPVTNVSGNVLTLQVPADAALVYPLTVSVTRWADTSTFAGSSKIQDDGSTITVIKPLKQLVVVYRKTGIFTGRFTGEVETPFIFGPAYRGSDVPAYPAAVASVNGDYHVYPTKNRFCYFDGAGTPQVHKTLDDARTRFFVGLSRTFAVDNVDTKEVWFCNGSTILAFDYHSNTASSMGYFPVYAACQTRGSWGFVVVSYDILRKQSLTTFGINDIAFFDTTIQSGFGALNDDHDQKILRGYGAMFSNQSVSKNATVRLYGRDGTNASAELLCTVTHTTPSEVPLVETYFRNVYFQDFVSVAVSSSLTAPLRLLGRTFKVMMLRTNGGTRTDTGNA